EGAVSRRRGSQTLRWCCCAVNRPETSVIARSERDEAIQLLAQAALDCFADARNDEGGRARALLDPRHVLAAADADRAAFDTDSGGAELKQMPGVNVAVVDIVELTRPSARAFRDQAEEHRHADERTPAQCRIVIMLIGPRTAGLRIVRGFRRGDHG